MASLTNDCTKYNDLFLVFSFSVIDLIFLKDQNKLSKFVDTIQKH